MLLRKILHHVRLIIVLVFGIGFGLVVGGLFYLNQSGVNEQWRARISTELESLGVYADFDRLTVSPTKGLIAQGVTLYTDNSRDDVMATLEHLVIDIDKTKIMRGIVRVNHIALRDANVTLPLDPDDPGGHQITIEKLSGTLGIPDKDTVEARKLSGMIAGIRVEIDANIWSSHLDETKQPKPIQDARVARIKLIARIIQEIKKWHWQENKSPVLKLYLEGDVDNPDSMRLNFAFKAEELESQDVTLREIHLLGDYNNKILTLDTFNLEDDTGKISARAFFNPAIKQGRFEATSTLHVQRLARNLFDQEIMTQLTFSTPPEITCTGTIRLRQESAPEIYLSGKAEVRDFSCLGSRFDKLTTDFSIRGQDLFLTKLHAEHPRGELNGRILMKNETVRYEAVSTLPMDAYNPFIKGSAIEQTLANATFTDASKIEVTTTGSINQRNLTDWHAKGTVSFKNITYQDTPLYELSGNFEMNQLRSEYRDIKAHFDYNDYRLRKKHGGPGSARVSVNAIKVDLTRQTVSISDLRGTAWPAPIVRLFVRGVADHVEQYRFHRPPVLRANGTFDLQSNGTKTDFRINVSNSSGMGYDFLGEPLNLRRLRAHVKITDDRVVVSNLSFLTFYGPCNGNITVFTNKPNHTTYRGGIRWQRLHLKEIGRTYDFGDAERGLLTGRMDFSGRDDTIALLEGTGSISLEQGSLFSVPMLGPITPLIGAVLGKRNPMEETAKNASCTFNIRKGVLYSNDFVANTRSLKFTGDGSINLDKKQLDMTMRMNARGVLGVFALPLRPFIGLFQFKGTGDISDPKWKTVVFAKPKRGKQDPIFRKPPRARPIRE